jgi:ribosomal-protein-alanine N-acetyltransferase
MVHVERLKTEDEKITLRRLSLEHAPAFFAAVDADRNHLSQYDENVSEDYPDIESVQSAIAEHENSDALHMGIWDEDTFVGMTSVTPLDDSRVAVGYWVRASEQGKGYATIATRTLALVSQSQFEHVDAMVHPHNERSKRVLAKSGFYSLMILGRPSPIEYFRFHRLPMLRTRAQ